MRVSQIMPSSLAFLPIKMVYINWIYKATENKSLPRVLAL